MNDLTEAALDYAAKGWHVFPLAPNSKRPAIPSHTAGECDGSDPYCAEGHLGWEERSTVDRDEIHALWASGRHGIAIATGPSHLLVVDIDVSKVNGAPIGMQSLAQLEARCGHRRPRTHLHRGHTFRRSAPLLSVAPRPGRSSRRPLPGVSAPGSIPEAEEATSLPHQPRSPQTPPTRSCALQRRRRRHAGSFSSCSPPTDRSAIEEEIGRVLAAWFATEIGMYR